MCIVLFPTTTHRLVYALLHVSASSCSNHQELCLYDIAVVLDIL